MNAMSLTLLTPPSLEPVDATQVKLAVRVSGSALDNHIALLIPAVRMYGENLTHRAFITQAWRMTLDCWPKWDHFRGTINVPMPRLLTVTALKYYDTAGVLQTLDPAAYIIDIACEPGRIVPAEGYVWPLHRDRPGAIIVEYTAGYGATAADVPVAIKTWMLGRIGTLLENPEHVSIDRGIVTAQMPRTFADGVLDQFTVARI